MKNISGLHVESCCIHFNPFQYISRSKSTSAAGGWNVLIASTADAGNNVLPVVGLSDKDRNARVMRRALFAPSSKVAKEEVAPIDRGVVVRDVMTSLHVHVGTRTHAERSELGLHSSPYCSA